MAGMFVRLNGTKIKGVVTVWAWRLLTDGAVVTCCGDLDNPPAIVVNRSLSLSVEI